MVERYFFELDQRFSLIVKECIERLKGLNIPISKSIYFAFNGGYSYYGRTYFGATIKKCKGYDYYVTVNKFCLNDSDIKNTVVHELLHTVKGGMCHSGAWRKYADFVNEVTDYEITVTSKTQLDKRAYLRKKAFDIKDYDQSFMDVVFCPVCKKQICLRKGLKRYDSQTSVYLCAKCRVRFIYK